MSKIDVDKDLRDRRILDLHNEGKSISEIMPIVGMSKGGIHKVLTSFLSKGDVPDKKKVVEVKINGDEERIESFSGLVRTNVDEYAHEKTSDVIRVVFVKATEPGGFGYFVKLGEVEKKSNPVDDVINEVEKNLANGKEVKL